MMLFRHGRVIFAEFRCIFLSFLSLSFIPHCIFTTRAAGGNAGCEQTNSFKWLYVLCLREKEKKIDEDSAPAVLLAVVFNDVH